MADEHSDVDITTVERAATSLTDLQYLISQFCDHATEIKSFICSKLSRTTYEGIKSSDVCKKGEAKVTRLFLFDICDKFLSLSNSLAKYSCHKDNSQNLEKLLSSNMSKYISEAEEKRDISKMIINATEKALQTHSEAIERQLTDLRKNLSLMTSRDARYDDNVSDNPDYVQTINCTAELLEATHDNFVTPKSLEELKEFLNTQDISAGALSFGRIRQCENAVFPHCIKNIIEELKSYIKKQGRSYELNSCQVDRCSTVLPEDDYSINPESSMFILPTGSNPILFKNRISGDQQSIVPKSGTIFQMSRASQNIFFHKVGIVKPCNEVSYTITFKSVDRKFHMPNRRQ